ncbi:MAG TPA: potassium-transporting ATPase subunit F [Gemmatimonadaceae bacterium]|nr:potassium-transporting ATPase subunit F [Gemmatimonadaceae bacterium]
MSPALITGLAVVGAALVLAYLLYTLIRPERF